MGAVAFFIFMVIIFFSGIGLLLLSFALFLYGKIKKRSKKSLRHFVAVISLIVGIVMIVVPISWVSVLRSTNGAHDQDYIDTGTMINWEEEDGKFIYQNVPYKRLTLTQTSILEYACYSPQVNEKQAVFNIQIKDGFFVNLLNGHEQTTMYLVDSQSGSTIYYSPYYTALYTASDDVKKVKDYYLNKAEYQWSIELNDDKNKPLPLSASQFKALRSMTLSNDNTTAVNLNTIGNNNYFSLTAVSKDQLVSISVDVFKYDNHWYVDTQEAIDEGEEDERILACRLPSTISELIEQTLK